MCGIIGYIGKDNPQEILIEGLKKLEYRGYDSAGIALKNKNEIQIIKSVGKISNLEEKIKKEKKIESNIGIAHTRWATHGIPNEINAHPHQVGSITLVHNGIIENAEELRKELEKKNVKFNSETDTEVIAALINNYYEDNMELAIEKATKLLKGSYALAILCEDDEKLYAIRKESPLILGIGKEEFFVTSDIGAILKYTRDYILLEENEIVIMDKDKYTIKKDGIEIKKEILKSTLTDEDSSLHGYEHYMLKEIMEEPVLVDHLIQKYQNDIEKLPDLKKYKHIHIIGCGSAYYAGMIGKNFYEEKAHISCVTDVASEYRYRNIIYDENTLVILISQSGETADTIAAMRKAIENHIDTLAIVNVEGSTIARESTYKVLIEAGREVAVATTKAYILQVLILSLLSYKINPDKEYLEDIKKLPQQLKVILDKTEFYQELAEKIYQEEDVFFIGRRVDYAISLEGSLKLKEVSYIHSDAYQAGELKHGTISLVNEGTIVFGIVTDEVTKEKTISNLEEVISRGAIPIYVGNEKSKYENEIIVPKVHKKLQPILVVPTLQMIAYYVAKKRECNIDKPKNLAKSVTVE